MENRDNQLSYKLKEIHKNDKISHVTRVSFDLLFPGDHNVGVYYQKLISVYFYLFPNKLVCGNTFFYDSPKAQKELNFSNYQVNLCKNKLIKDGWISIKRQEYRGKIRSLISLNLVKLDTKLRELQS